MTENYNFDELTHRQNTNSMKWDKYKNSDIIPLWVADMDFKCAEPIIEALNKVNKHGIIGYSNCPDELTAITIKRLQNLHHWQVEKDWLVWLPGLVPGLNLSCRAVGQTNDEVMTLTPVYHHFMYAPKNAQRELLKVPMILKDQRWTIDFDLLKSTISPKTKLFLLCNPHNPAGTVFTKNELKTLADICLEHNIIICSDEIHCDLILDESTKHISIATLSKEIEQNTITLLSPSKTFNIAGLGCSLAVIPNEEIRKRFKQEMAGILPSPSAHSFEAALAAYKHGEIWHNEMLAYLRKNHDYLLQEINAIDGLEMMSLEATYLAWIDTRKTGIEDIGTFLENAGIGISDGSVYFDGAGFIRLNFATQKSRLEEVIRRIKVAFKK